MTPDFLLQLALAVCAGAGVYAAIRTDLVTAKMRAEQAAKDAENAHVRIDEHITEHLRGLTHGN